MIPIPVPYPTPPFTPSQDNEASVRKVAIEVLALLTGMSDHVVQQLLRLELDDLSVRQALAQIAEEGDPHAITAVRARLEHHNSSERRGGSKGLTVPLVRDIAGARLHDGIMDHCYV